MSDAKVYDKLEKIEERLSSIDVHLAKYNTQLEYHIDRTDRLEAIVMETQDELKPIIAHVEQVRGVGKFVGISGTVVGILSAIGGAIMWLVRH